MKIIPVEVLKKLLMLHTKIEDANKQLDILDSADQITITVKGRSGQRTSFVYNANKLEPVRNNLVTSLLAHRLYLQDLALDIQRSISKDN